MEMKTNGNDAAFAVKDDNFLQEGLSKREYFAAMAMQGMLAAGDGEFSFAHHTRISKLAVAHADVLIEALNKE